MSVPASRVEPGLRPSREVVGELHGVLARPALGVATVTVTAAVVALASAQVLPRGPVTAGQGLLLMATGLIVGLVAGAAWSSRGTGLLAFITYVACFEVGRLSAVGPTVDGIRLDNTF